MRLFFLLFLSILQNALAQNVQIKTITVEPYMSTENYEHFKRMVLNSSDSQARHIDGFDFDWGYRYTLRVKRTKIGPLSDGTLYEFSHIETLSKSKVPDSTTFTLGVDPLTYYSFQEEDSLANFTLRELNDSTFLYMDLVELEIPQQEQSRFQTKKSNNLPFIGDFHFVNERTIRLIRMK
jgi:hypothetical protein